MLSLRSALGLVLACTLGAGACSDDSKPAPTPDKGVTQKDGQTPVTVTCNATKSDCKDFVLSKLVLPLTSADVKTYGLQFKGQSYNALGNILMALASMSSGLALQDSVDAAVNAGTTVILARVHAKDFANDTAAAGQAWVGAPATCCPTSGTPVDPAKCKTEAPTTCFKGDFSFTVDPTSPKDATMSGSITAGALSFTADALTLTIPLTGAGTITVNMKAVQFKGTISDTGIANGILAGAIPKKDVDESLIPNVATMLNNTLSDSTVTQATKDQIKTLFDTDKDGKITKEEVANNSLIKLFLAGDVDVDGDGANELSLGIGFSGVKAVISGK